MFNLGNAESWPIWLRAAIVAVTLGWGGLELATGAVGWAVLFLGAGAYLVWRFFLTPDPKDKP
jgi:hypothetical protein